MSYSEMAQLELMNALNNISTEAELNEFKNLLAHYFAQKAQKAIDALWDKGVINEETIEQWGKEHMRTPYGYETRRPFKHVDWPRLTIINIKEFTKQLRDSD